MKIKRIETLVWPDGVRTAAGVVRVGAGMPVYKSVVVREAK